MSIVSVEDAKAHLNISDSADDALIGRYINTAESFIDRWLAKPMAEMSPVPPDLTQAVLMLTGHFYENREATFVGVTAETTPFGVWDIISQHREYVF